MDPVTALMIAQAVNAGGNWLANMGGGDEENVQLYDKYQQQGHEQNAKNLKNLQGGYDQATGLLQKYLDPNSDIYKNFEQQYLNNFNERTLPAIAEQFAGFSGEGAGLQSSGFGQALSSGARGLQTDLAAMKSGMQRDAIKDYLNLYNQQSTQLQNAKPIGKRDPSPPISPFNFSQGAIQGLFSNPAGGQNYQAQYPLTQGYDQQFRMTGLPGYG